MHFLDVSALVAWNGDDVVGCGFLQTHSPTKRDGDGAFFFGSPQPTKHVFGTTTGGHADHDVATRGERFHLSLEQRSVAEVVGDAGDDTRVTDERDSR